MQVVNWRQYETVTDLCTTCLMQQVDGNNHGSLKVITIRHSTKDPFVTLARILKLPTASHMEHTLRRNKYGGK